MQTWRWKAWEIWSHAVVSCNGHPRAGGQSIYKVASIRFIVCIARDESMQKEELLQAALPTTYDQISQAPFIFAFCK